MNDLNHRSIMPIYKNLYIPKHNNYLAAIHSAGKQHQSPGFYFPGEVHDFWEMCYVLRGNLTVAEDDRIYALYPNDVIFHRPMEFHTLKVSNSSDATFIIISFKYVGNEIEPLSRGTIKLSADYTALLENMLENISNTFCYPGDTNLLGKKTEDYSSVSERLCLIKFESFLLSLLDNLTVQNHQKYTTAAIHYKKIMNVLQEHIYEKLSVDEIAKLCHLSRSNLKKVFKAYSGYGVMQYFNKMKIIKSIDMLKADMTISQISDALSYSSPSYFSNAFKRETGYFPFAYKKEALNKSIGIK